MIENFMFWLMKPLAEIAIGIAFALALGLLCALGMLPSVIRRARCQHAKVHENGACDAICRNCGKNLGFIGTWREKHPSTD